MKDVATLQAGRPIDLIVFSGDLSFSAQPDQFSIAQTQLLEPLRNLCGLSVDRLILAPGNHDVDISLIDEIGEAGLRATLKSRDSVNKLLDDASAVARHTTRLDSWRRFYREYTSEDFQIDDLTLTAARNYEIDSARVGVAILSSCWRATGAGDDADRSHLLVGDRQASIALAKIAGADLRLVVMHHPLDWLEEFDRRGLSLSLRRSADVLFTGHVHYSDPEQLIASTGQLIHSQAGSLYQWRDYMNSYSVIDIDLERRDVAAHMRTYFDERQTFDRAVNVAADGVAVFQLTPKSGAADVVATPPPGELSSELVLQRSEEAASALLESIRETSVLADRLRSSADRMAELLIQPVLLPMPIEQYIVAIDQETGERPPRADSLVDLKNTRCLVIVGEESSGLSSALAWHAYEAYRMQPELVPVMIDFRNFPAGLDPVGKAARASLALCGIIIKRKDDLPPLALAVDNVGSRPPAHVNRLVQRIASTPEDLVVLGCRPGDEIGLDQKLSNAGVEHLIRYIGPFGRRELRQLVTQIEPTRVGEITKAVLATLSRESLPRTPFMIVALVAIVTEDARWAAAGTETAVLDAYVGMLLGRGDPSDDSRIDLDYRDREHILSSLAEKLLRDDLAAIPRLDAEEFLIKYFRSLGWSVPPGAVIDGLIDRRVLRQRGSMLEFRQTALLYFFSAQRLLESLDFRAHVLANPLWYPAVIRHAAAIRRSDEDLLKYANGLLIDALQSLPTERGNLFSMVTDQEGWTAEDVDELIREPAAVDVPEGQDVEDYQDNDGEGSEVRRFESNEGIFDDLLDQIETSSLIRSQQLDVRPELTPAETLSQTVNLASSILRSSELVTNPALKRELLERVLLGFAESAAMTALDEGFADFTERLLTVFFGALISDPQRAQEVVARGKLIAPVTVSYIAMLDSLSSLKLARILEVAMADSSFKDDAGQFLMSCLLAADLRTPGWARQLVDILKLHGNKRVVREVVHFIAQSTYYEKQAPEDVAVLQGLLADDALMNSVYRSERERKAVRGRLVQRLRARRAREIRNRDREINMGILDNGAMEDDRTPPPLIDERHMP